jgi:hypothetical protein
MLCPLEDAAVNKPLLFFFLREQSNRLPSSRKFTARYYLLTSKATDETPAASPTSPIRSRASQTAATTKKGINSDNQRRFIRKVGN